MKHAYVSKRKPNKERMGEEGCPVYTADDDSEWEMLCGGGHEMEEVLSILKADEEKGLWIPEKLK